MNNSVPVPPRTRHPNCILHIDILYILITDRTLLIILNLAGNLRVSLRDLLKKNNPSVVAVVSGLFTLNLNTTPDDLISHTDSVVVIICV